LPYAVADGPHNMGADEVLLESALAGTASLRFYGWSPATLSLGYFQADSVRQSDDSLRRLPYVRRPSGGGTLIHHHEVTYGLGLPPGMPWQARDSWLPRMHAIIAAALVDLGIPATLQASTAAEPFTGFLCFQHFTPGDLRIRDAKIVGSAQRRQRKALLQHGSILLRASPHSPMLPGILEQTGRTVPVVGLCAAITAELVRQTGWSLIEGMWTEAERKRTENLAAAKYGQDAWNRKR
jgi:lipoate-protein ligase A